MNYQDLNLEKDEIRLLYLVLNEETEAASDQNEWDTSGVVHLEMKTVSLGDYTSKSRKHLASKGLKRYTSREAANQLISHLATFDASSKKYQANEEKILELFCRPDFGRWRWGDFSALSYVWGDKLATDTILVNGTPMQVTKNLASFFRHYFLLELSYKEKHAFQRHGLWVDAICINQADLRERNLQVKRMGDIYGQAMEVVAWLGPSADESPKAIGLINQLGMKTNLDEAQLVEYMGEIRQGKVKFEPGCWIALERLVARPYWWRMWIIQEVVQARRVLKLMCGDFQISWPMLCDVIGILTLDMQTVIQALQTDRKREGLSSEHDTGLTAGISRIQRLGLFITMQYSKDEFGPCNPLHLLPIGMLSEQSDARDKVYAILSLLGNKITSLITPDYGRPVALVYLDFTIAVIKSTKSVDIIGHHRRSPPTYHELPSWVPDFREVSDVEFGLATGKPYAASQNSVAEVSLNGQVLKVRGLIIDKVDGLVTPRSINSTKIEVIQPKSGNLMYQGIPALQEALIRTLLVDQDAFNETAPTWYYRIAHIPWPTATNPSSKSSEMTDVYLKYFDNFRRLHENFRLGEYTFRSCFQDQGASSSSAALPLQKQAGSRPAKSKRWDLAASVISKRKIASNTMRDISTENEQRHTTKDSFPLIAFHNATWGRALMITQNGYLGLACLGAEQGDVLAILLGCSYPVVLRLNVDGETYRFIGEAYVHGVMEGEAMEWLKDGTCILQDIL